MSVPLVHILIVNYNAWPDTLACLRALEQLRYPNHRVLVLDNVPDNIAETLRQGWRLPLSV
ncbi:MAG: hypothetical protein N2Z75_08305 [Meiothermus sp.]|nr:hypothetical protein [Meiothermus sp.]